MSDARAHMCQVAGYSDKTWLRGKETRVTPDQIEQSVNDSLQRLQTDHLDLLQIHWPDRYLPLFGSGIYDPQKEREDDVSYDEQLRGLEKVIKAGKVSICCHESAHQNHAQAECAKVRDNGWFLSDCNQT